MCVFVHLLQTDGCVFQQQQQQRVSDLQASFSGGRIQPQGGAQQRSEDAVRKDKNQQSFVSYVVALLKQSRNRSLMGSVIGQLAASKPHWALEVVSLILVPDFFMPNVHLKSYM